MSAIENIDKKLNRLKQREEGLQLEEQRESERIAKLKESGSELNEHAGWKGGYIQGQLAELSNQIDFLEELKTTLI